MLHILWLILKFILILLGVLLGLALLLVALVLFCPVRYQGRGTKYDSDWRKTEGQIAVSWLFRGISATAYRKDGTNGITVRLLGISLNNLIRFFQERREKKNQRPGKRKKKLAEKKKQEENDTSESKNGTADVPDIEEAVCEELEECQETVEKILEPESMEVKTEETVSDEEEDAILEEMLSQELEKEKADSENPQSSRDSKKKGFLKKLLDKLSEIPRKVEAMKSAYRRIRNKAEWWNRFFHHPRVQAAISLVWKYAKGLLKHILPTKVWGQITFGFSDPSITGRVLGILGMSIPFHKNCVAVRPVFNGENILEGEVHLKGRIYGVVLLKAAIAIYFNKNVKYAIKRARHGKHKEE